LQNSVSLAEVMQLQLQTRSFAIASKVMGNIDKSQWSDPPAEDGPDPAFRLSEGPDRLPVRLRSSGESPQAGIVFFRGFAYLFW